MFPIDYFNHLKTSITVSQKALEVLESFESFNGMDDYRKWLNALSDIELKYLADIIVNGEINSRSRFETVHHIENTEKLFKSVHLHNKQIKDYKSQLWIPLPIKEKQRVFLNQKDTQEGKLMTMLV